MTDVSSQPTPCTDEDLRRAAREVAVRAYSPYSRVRVGAALRSTEGSVFVGCNVENASYGLTLCAERSAMVRAVSDGARSFDAIAIWASPEAPLFPCGACRQFLSELAPDLRVLLEGAGGGRSEHRLSDLLPNAVASDDLR